MSPEVLEATLDLRRFLFDTVYESQGATAEFKKATGILGGLWTAVRDRASEFLDPTVVEKDGLDTATCDFIAGMTDRYAVALFERLYIPAPWAG
jgi:dGTPase